MATTQIQTWGFGRPVRGCVIQTVDDPEKASKTIHEAFVARNVSEIVVWYPDHEVLHAVRALPDDPWRVVKGGEVKDLAAIEGARKFFEAVDKDLQRRAGAALRGALHAWGRHPRGAR